MGSRNCKFDLSRRWFWVSLACFVGVIVVLMWPVGTWLQCRDMQNSGTAVDAVYLLAGGRHQRIRLDALEDYLSSRKASAGLSILIGSDVTEGRWNREYQKNLLMHEWAVVEIKGMRLSAGLLNAEIVVVPGSFTGTDGEMEALATYLREKKTVRHLALVSTSFHLRRSTARFNNYSGGDVEVSVVAAGSWDERMPWTVLLELGKMTRDMVGLSRNALLSRE